MFSTMQMEYKAQKEKKYITNSVNGMMGVNESGEIDYSNEDRTKVQIGMKVIVCKIFKVRPCTEVEMCVCSMRKLYNGIRGPSANLIAGMQDGGLAAF